MSNLHIRPLSALNTNYQPPRSWTCQTEAEHHCVGPVVGAIGAYPCCRNGVAAERDRREVEQARLDALLADPVFRAQIEREARQEAAWERQFA